MVVTMWMRRSTSKTHKGVPENGCICFLYAEKSHRVHRSTYKHDADRSCEEPLPPLRLLFSASAHDLPFHTT
jgi:hypothetical protein